MVVELISTGSELLLGDLLNTNVTWLAKELNNNGFTVAFQSSVGDNPERMTEVFAIAAKRADIIISSGGLGPTQGDITRQCLAAALDLPIVHNEAALDEVKLFFKTVQRDLPSESRREAALPKGAEPLHNPVGVAPGVALQHNGKVFILLPGPPSEMKGVFQDSALPYLKHIYGNQGIVKSIRYAVYGVRELDLERTVMDLIKSQSNPTIALLIKKGYIELRITAKAETEAEAISLLEPWDDILHERLGDKLGRSLDVSIEELLAKVLIDKGITVATAESCTGGIVGKRLTDLPGSSAYYQGGVISYSNDVKRQVLGVPQDMLAAYGAVSEQVAKAMAEGVRRVVGTDYGISTTGIAGPSGATETKPVGLVYMAVAGPNGTKVFKENYIDDRERVRSSAAESILAYLYTAVK